MPKTKPAVRPASPAPPTATHDRLLAAAVDVIASDGWGAATTRRIARRADVNPALVHYHFGSLAELRRGAVWWALANEVGGPTDALFGAATLVQGIGECLQAIDAIDPGSPSVKVLQEAMLVADRDPELATGLRAALADFRTVLAAAIRSEHGVAPEAAATLVAAVLDGLWLHRLVDPAVRAGSIESVLVDALGVPKRRAPGRGSR